jgi:hypothetical protein
MSRQALSNTLRDQIYHLNFLYSRLPESEKAKNTLKLQAETSDMVKPH